MSGMARKRRLRPPVPPDGQTLGARLLLQFRHQNDLTQTDVALALGVSTPTIHDWERGRKRPKAHHRDDIATWTKGFVPASAWKRPGEVSGVVPFSPEPVTKGAA